MVPKWLLLICLAVTLADLGLLLRDGRRLGRQR